MNKIDKQVLDELSLSQIKIYLSKRLSNLSQRDRQEIEYNKKMALIHTKSLLKRVGLSK